MHLQSKRQAAFTLPELMVTAMILGVFFSGIFEVSGLCMRYISSSKENINGIECVQDRVEQLRNLSFANLADNSTVKTAMATPPNSSGLAKLGTETVTLTNFSGTSASSPTVTYTRTGGATSATMSPAGFTGFDTTAVTALQVDVSYTWTAVLGRRARTQSSSTIVVAGTKK